MKKIIYSFVVLLAFCLSGCEEVDNLSNSGESRPVVTLYNYAVPAGADADATVNLRLVPNQACAEFCLLVEKKVDKDAFIAENGEDAYAARVVEKGQKYPAETLDYLNEQLGDTYVITVVAIGKNGAVGVSKELVFYGINWVLKGNAIYSDPSVAVIFGPNYSYVNVPVKWYESANLKEKLYKLGGRFDSLSPNFAGYNIKLNWDETGEITFHSGVESTTPGMWWLDTPFTNSTYGAIWQDVDLDPAYTYYDAESKTVVINFRRAVSAGSFAGWYDMIIELPD
ncbi:hypothetical protein LJC52_03300 [Bacteroidales bacterium OttesenSCG-928-A17]|nr:hypothetical protein [Bacteroidales bacterium OttesenSCG-928-A17]